MQAIQLARDDGETPIIFPCPPNGRDCERVALMDGERFQIETHDGNILIRRAAAHTWIDALAAAEEIISDRVGYSLGDITISALIDEGRRG